MNVTFCNTFHIHNIQQNFPIYHKLQVNSYMSLTKKEINEDNKIESKIVEIFHNELTSVSRDHCTITVIIYKTNRQPLFWYNKNRQGFRAESFKYMLGRIKDIIQTNRMT